MALLSVHRAYGVCRVALRIVCQTQAYSAAPNWPTAISSARQVEGHDTLIINFRSTGTITLKTDNMMEDQRNHHDFTHLNPTNPK